MPQTGWPSVGNPTGDCVLYSRPPGGRGEGCDRLNLSWHDVDLQIVPTRGMGISVASAGDFEREYWPQFGWTSPSAPDVVHPSLVNLAARGGLGWLDGFTEFLTRCGLSWMGPPGDDPGGNPTENPLTLHGRIANTPADRWEMRKEDDRLIVEGDVSERSLFGSNLMLHARYEAEVGSPELHLTDTVTNAGDTPAEMMLLYHINQTPLGSRVIVPCEEVIPRDPRAAEGGEEWEGPENWATLGPPTPGFAEQAYFIKPRPDADGRGRMLMPADDGSAALEVRFELNTLPWCVLWKQFGGERDGYVVGMEPATCLPNHRSFEREKGRVVTLQPDETRVMNLTMRFLTEPDEVRDAVEQAEALAADPPTVHPQPLPEFCSAAA
jgi:galactose mutarotase-like enzyme